MRRYTGSRVAGTALLLAWAAAAGCGKKKEAAGGAGGGRGAPPTAVRVAVASRIDAPVTVTASGVVDPMQTVAVQSQVSGTLQSVEFREGDFVQPGQVLFRVDPRPLLAMAAQARAALARDVAQAEAARRNDVRYQTLVRQDYVAREEADQVHAASLAASATVEADRAALAAAEVNLSYATIRAPIAGKTGAMLVRAGNLVGPATGPLVVINQLSPVLVRFPILSQDLPLLQGAVARHPLEVTAVRSDSGQVSEIGTLSFLDNSVDSLTGTVSGKAVFQNRTSGFWPGELVFLTVKVAVQQNVLVVPSVAVLTGQQGSYVYVVDSQKTARTRPVVAGRTVGDLVIVSSGLTDGETVVVDGQGRLKPGAKVAIITGNGGGGSRGTGGAPGSPAGGSSGGAAGPSGAVGAGGAAAAGGAPAGSGGQPGGATAGTPGARTNGAAGQTGTARTGGGATVSSSSTPVTTPTGARSGTGNGSASPVAPPPPSPAGGGSGRPVAGGARPPGATTGTTGTGTTPGAAPAGGARP